MRILIEEYKYNAADVKEVINGIDALENIEGKVSIHYVGYYYNPQLKDCVFILPKVLLEGENGKELVFGKYFPESIIDLDANNPLSKEEYSFIYEFSVWIYRSIVVFKDSHTDSGIVYHKQIAKAGKGSRRLSNTFLDILLEIIRFNRENKNFFFFVLRNIHSGINKINWNRTISTTNAIIQDQNPVYLNPVNKKRQINFDEELLVIFFSILNYIGDTYGFPKNTDCNFDLIKGRQFETYLKGLGKTRLLQIKYKYFSDKALELWNLCYAFFDRAKEISISAEQKEYLLVKNYNIVFEAIIDELVGDTENIPKGLKEQEDGKLVDHIFTYKNLINNEEDKPIYYIGDSKYYKRKGEIGKQSVYKQFTYARNVIQWNLNLFMNDDKDDEDLQFDKKNFGNVPKLRDDVTEGYNIIPNFFISARLNEKLDYNDDIELADRQTKFFTNRQFDNRLFDRDTLLICHYDVNFLYVVSLYARNNALQKKAWKEKVREMFRSKIQEMLEEQYDFYAMTPREGVNADEFLKENFQQLLGKVFTPYNIEGPQKYYSLALDNDPKFENENELVLALLEPGFYYEKCSLGDNPAKLLPEVKPTQVAAVPSSLLTVHHIQRYQNKHFLIGCYHSDEQLAWILGKNDKQTNLYNVRLKKRGSVARDGALSPAFLAGTDVKFVILYRFGEENSNQYRVFHVHHHATMDEARMRQALYPDPKGNYFCFVFDEEVQLSSKIDLEKIISEAGNSEEYPEGAPVFKTGEELMQYIKP